MHRSGDKKEKGGTKAIGKFDLLVFQSGVPQGLTAKIGEHCRKSLWSKGFKHRYQAAGTEQVGLERDRTLACFCI